MKLTLGFSPCPNDCFIFDALVHKRINTGGLDFKVVMEDVEALNRKAFNTEIDITKLSYHAFLYLTERYTLLQSGSALGFNCGPLLISKRNISRNEVESGKIKIAIPGKYTTANFLLSLAFPLAQNKTEVLFSEIENKVLSGEYDAGLIIHENRFTYAERGLKKIIDLGEFWEGLIHSPIPLGGIVMKKNFDSKLIKTIERLIRESVQYAFRNPEASKDFVRANAQEMSESVMQKHIQLYVNEYSIDLGEKGRGAIELMRDKAIEKKIIPANREKLWI